MRSGCRGAGCFLLSHREVSRSSSYAKIHLDGDRFKSVPATFLHRRDRRAFLSVSLHGLNPLVMGFDEFDESLVGFSSGDITRNTFFTDV